MLAYSRKSKVVYYPDLDSASAPSIQASPPPASGILDPQENTMKSIVSEAEASGKMGSAMGFWIACEKPLSFVVFTGLV
jgi:hypothetical protein